MHGLIHIYSLVLCSESLETGTHISAAISTPGTKILASNTQHHYPMKEIRILGDTNSTAGSGNTQDKPGTSSVIGKKRFKYKGHERGAQ